MHRLRFLSRIALLAFTGLTPVAQGATLPSLRPGIAPLALAAAGSCSQCKLLGVERRVLVGGGGPLAEYTFPVRVGAGDHEVVRLHRVVKESAPFVPVHAPHALFLAHGDIWPFDAAFLNAVSSSAVPDTLALPIFLAARGVDVWGIDFRWTQVPAGTTDFSFMAGWGIATDAQDLRIAMGIARLTRGLGGDGLGRLPLLGWSRGGQIGYAALDAETQVPPALRQIKSFIPVDILVKTDQAAVKDAACLRLGLALGSLAGGQIADTTGGLVALIGQLVKTAPAGASPIVPGFTNRQTALLAGVATFQLQPPGGANVPFYHFAGGTFDGLGFPSGVTYQGEAGFFDFLTGSAPFEPLQILADGDAALCESSPSIAVPNVPFDDHLGQIKVPILYVGAGGGFGDFGIYTTTLLGSTDVTIHVVSLTPPAQRLFDIGHADIFNATDAPALFWQPIYDWLVAH